MLSHSFITNLVLSYRFFVEKSSLPQMSFLHLPKNETNVGLVTFNIYIVNDRLEGTSCFKI